MWLEKFLSCNSIEMFCEERGYVQDLDSIPEDRLELISRYIRFGDYDTSCAVERSNHRLFLEKFGRLKGISNVPGDYGGDTVHIRWCEFVKNKKEDIQEVLEVLQGLDDYPCIDDEDVSFMEQEMYGEAWPEIKDDIIERAGFHPEDVPGFPEHMGLFGLLSSHGVFFVEAGGHVWFEENAVSLVKEFMGQKDKNKT
jgi:hypothetical protein